MSGRIVSVAAAVYSRRYLASILIGALLLTMVWQAIRPIWITGLRLTAGIQFTEFSSVTPNPLNIAQASDSRMFYVGSNPVIATTLFGLSSATYPIPSTCRAHDITRGPDSAMWFTEPNCQRIGRVDTAGNIVEYPLTNTTLGLPWDIITGPDLNLWFTLTNSGCSTGMDCGATAVGRINPNDHTMQFFLAPSRFGNATELTLGLDGNVWFTEPGVSSLARVTPAGTITEFPGTGGANQIALGSDGRLWFSGGPGNTYGVMTTNGIVLLYSFPIGAGGLYQTADLITARDGNVWFSATRQDAPTSPLVGVLGSIAPSGSVVDYPLPPAPDPCCSRSPRGLAADSDGRIWYTDVNQNLVGHTDPLVMHGGLTASEFVGGSNPSELAIICPACGAPVNLTFGDLWHTYRDLGVPGRGLALDLERTYDSNVAAQDGPLGFGWRDSYAMSLTFDAGGNATIVQENGSTIAFQRGIDGSFSAAPRVLATLTANADGTTTLKRKAQTQFTFDVSGHLVSESDRNGYVTSLTYSGGRLATVTDSAGRALTFATNAGGHIASVSDPAGRSVLYLYSQAGDLTSMTDVGGGSWKYSYDSQHRLLSLTDPMGGVTSNTYDSSGRVARQTDAVGQARAFQYAVDTTTVTQPNGRSDVFAFDNGSLASITRAAGTLLESKTTFQHDTSNSGGFTKMTDANGQTWSLTLDAMGNAVSVTDPLGRTNRVLYTSLNDVASVTDATGNTTTFDRDSRGNLLAVNQPLGVRTTYERGDPAHPSDVTALVDALGQRYTEIFDSAGNLISATDPTGSTTRATYDATGRRLTLTTPRGQVYRRTFDAFDSTLTQTDPLGDVATYAYDAVGNTVAKTDANGHPTRYTYDALNRVISALLPNGTSMTMTYDADGNVTAQTDGLGGTTSYSYDLMDRQIKTTDPLGRSSTYTYDLLNQPTAVVDAAGRTTSYIYDSAQQLVGVKYSDGTTPNVTYSYDANGLQVAMTDGTGTSSYSYDALSRLLSATNGAGQTVRYSYDLRGGQTSITYPSGVVVSRTYDPAGRLASTTDWTSHTSTFGYDADGNLVAEKLGNGVKASLQYDSAGRLTGLRYNSPTGQLLLGYAYTHDPAGMLTSSTPLPGTADVPTNYGYDPNNRVTSAGLVAGSGEDARKANETWSYDAGNNLTKRKLSAGEGGVVTTFTYDAAHQLVNSISQLGSFTLDSRQFTYDAVGDRTAVKDPSGKTLASYAYDQAGRLTAFAAAATYAYDGNGLRSSKTVNGTTQRFTWDISTALPLLLSDDKGQYLYGPAGPIEEVLPDGRTFYYLFDQIGSTRALVDQAGKVAVRYAYDAYGLTLASSGLSNPLQYAGEYTDAESGLQYLRSRYYDPATSAFLTADPMRAATGQPYAYAADSPTRLSDPSGQRPCDPVSNLSPGKFEVAIFCDIHGGQLFFETIALNKSGAAGSYSFYIVNPAGESAYDSRAHGDDKGSLGDRTAVVPCAIGNWTVYVRSGKDFVPNSFTVDSCSDDPSNSGAESIFAAIMAAAALAIALAILCGEAGAVGRPNPAPRPRPQPVPVPIHNPIPGWPNPWPLPVRPGWPLPNPFPILRGGL